MRRGHVAGITGLMCGALLEFADFSESYGTALVLGIIRTARASAYQESSSRTCGSVVLRNLAIRYHNPAVSPI